MYVSCPYYDSEQMSISLIIHMQTMLIFPWIVGMGQNLFQRCSTESTSTSTSYDVGYTRGQVFD